MHVISTAMYQHLASASSHRQEAKPNLATAVCLVASNEIVGSQLVSNEITMDVSQQDLLLQHFINKGNMDAQCCLKSHKENAFSIYNCSHSLFVMCRRQGTDRIRMQGGRAWLGRLSRWGRPVVKTREQQQEARK